MKKTAIGITLLFCFPIFLGMGQTEKEVKVKVGGETLYGTLTTVDKEKSKDTPIVLIIPGSGSNDRNGNAGFLQTNTYKYLAEELAENGISSLRYDKLFAGKSQPKNTKEEDLTFQSNVDWVEGWIAFLQKKKYTNILLAGHSEGSLIGILAAQESDIKKFISIAGAGRPIGEILVEQIAKSGTEKLSKETEEILTVLKKGEKVEKVPADLQALFRESVQPYLISWLKYNPKVEISKLNIPVLIVQGTTDIQVLVEDAELLKEGNPNAELVVIEGMGHILKDAPEDREKNLLTYYDANLPLNKEFLKVVIQFIKK